VALVLGAMVAQEVIEFGHGRRNVSIADAIHDVDGLAGVQVVHVEHVLRTCIRQRGLCRRKHAAGEQRSGVVESLRMQAHGAGAKVGGARAERPHRNQQDEGRDGSQEERPDLGEDSGSISDQESISTTKGRLGPEYVLQKLPPPNRNRRTPFLLSILDTKTSPLRCSCPRTE
jgi:hypothetical protein